MTETLAPVVVDVDVVDVGFASEVTVSVFVTTTTLWDTDGVVVVVGAVVLDFGVEVADDGVDVGVAGVEVADDGVDIGVAGVEVSDAFEDVVV